MQIPSRPYSFPVRADLSIANTALLCIDMQGDFLLPGGFMDAIGLSFETMRSPIDNIARLQKLCRQLGIAVLHTREGFPPDLSGVQPNRLWRGENGDHAIVGDEGPLGRYLIRGESGWEIVPEVAPVKGEPVFDKAGYGSFGASDIGSYLQDRGIANLIVCGVTAECCVHMTVQEALDRGFDCLTVRDATASAFTPVHENLMRQIELKGGVFGALADTQDVLDALTAIADPEETSDV